LEEKEILDEEATALRFTFMFLSSIKETPVESDNGKLSLKILKKMSANTKIIISLAVEGY